MTLLYIFLYYLLTVSFVTSALGRGGMEEVLGSPLDDLSEILLEKFTKICRENSSLVKSGYK